jgi:hypothetical protein
MIDILKDLSNYLFIGINALMGFVVTWHDMNQAAALLGILMTLVANSDKMLLSILRWRDIMRSGWKLPAAPKNSAKGEKEVKP